MRIIKTETTTYCFEELPEDIQEKAIENLYDINVDYSWWEFVYEDAENVLLKISEFDIDRASYVKADFIEYAENTAQKIIENHGDMCETFKTAEEYLKDRKELVKKYSDGVNIEEVAEDNELEFEDETEELDKEFLRAICEDYRVMLQNEYEYRTSEESIIETIKANEYEFTADGKIF